MSDHNSNTPNPDPSRRLRFSHDEGQPDDIHYTSSSPTPPANQQPCYTNPFLDTNLTPPPQSYSYNSPTSQPQPSPTRAVDGYGYQDFSAHPALSVPRPSPAQTTGSGLPGSGINRQGFASAAPPYPPPHDVFSSPSGQQSRFRYSSTSQETLVGDSVPPLKPALRRSSTEEHLRLQAAREAAGMVDSHLDGRPQQQQQSHFLAPPQHQHQQRSHQASYGDGWNDDDHDPENWQTEQRAAAGILSNLLRLYGDGHGQGLAGMNMHRGGGGSRSDGSRSSTGSNYGGQWEREQEVRRRHRRQGEADEGAFPRNGGRDGDRMKRAASTWTVGTNAEDKVYAPEDPRANGSGRRSEKRDEEKEERLEKAKEAHKDAAKKGDELAALDAAEHRDVVEGKAAKDEKKKKNKYKKYVHKDQITAHVASTLSFSFPPCTPVD
jgi:hypothetical protein